MTQQSQQHGGIMSAIDWRGLCEELVNALDEWQLGGSPLEDEVEQRLIDRARAALAQPEPEVAELSDEELDELFIEIDQSGESLSWRAFARSAIAADRARYGRPAPAPAGKVAELINELRRICFDVAPCDADTITRAADLLERLASPTCLVLDPSPETIAALKAAGPGRIELLTDDAQVIEPTERTILVPATVPVPVPERPWERDGWCDEQGQCWMGDPGGGGFIASWRLCRPEDAPRMRVSLPFNALPLPSGEVEHA